MNGRERHLYVAAIGPVQDFIASARTSNDLHFGSWLLSELSKAAARWLSGEPHQLIFPAPQQDLEPASPLSVANKIIAIVEGDPEETASQVREAVYTRLHDVYEDTYERIPGEIDRELAERQINDLIEFYWASVPYAQNQRYSEVRAMAEALLAARKNTRNFLQATGQEGTPKSSLDGHRESVLLQSSKLIGEDAFYADYRAEAGEALSGVDLLKRWGETGATSFPSTTDVAAQPFRIMLGEEREQALLGQIKELLKDYTEREETDGTCFYVERLAQLVSHTSKRREFRRAFADLFGNAHIRQSPGPYYALLLADGDNMGKTIDAQDDVEKHRRLSQTLSEFASEANQLIVDRGGAPVYVGGDDLLAYLPLHTVLQCISDLSERFSGCMASFSYHEDGESHSPTLSGALVVAHHLTPLSDVLEMARSAEGEAKGLRGKNALVVVLSKRGGVERTVCAKMHDLLERLLVLIEYSKQERISSGTAYELQTLHQQLSEAGLPDGAFQREAMRIIQRKREPGGGLEFQEQIRGQFETWFRDEDLTLDELAQEMIIAGEFAKVYEMAGISPGIPEEEA